jgi:hypothetical protein
MSYIFKRNLVPEEKNMRDFVGFCVQNKLVEVAEDGTVTWKEECMKGGKSSSYKNKFDGGRDQRKDLSADHKDYTHHMGTVWPFKVKGKGGKKAAAPVAK